jgi:hypothetical protein
MPLAQGDRIGPYKIRALIGKGGMGGVYRAHDPRLRRDGNIIPLLDYGIGTLNKFRCVVSFENA